MTKNGQYSFWSEEDQDKTWYLGWSWGFTIGILTMLLAAIGAILGLNVYVDAF